VNYAVRRATGQEVYKHGLGLSGYTCMGLPAPGLPVFYRFETRFTNGPLPLLEANSRRSSINLTRER